MVEKEKDIQKPNNENITDNDIINPNINNIIYKNNNFNKSSTNFKPSLNNTVKKNDKKDLYINTDFKNNAKIKQNINNNNNNNENNENDEKEKNTKNELTTTCMNSKNNNIIYFNNTIKSRKNSGSSSLTNTLNFNIYPLSRDSSKTYIKKKSANININNNNGSIASNMLTNTNRSSVIKHKKNYSISTSCYNTQRNSNKEKENKYNSKNKQNYNKNNYLYSPKKKQIEKCLKNNKSIVVSEYKIKLDNIKSRVSELLNVFSLIALRSINITNNKQGHEEKNNEHDMDI